MIKLFSKLFCKKQTETPPPPPEKQEKPGYCLLFDMLSGLKQMAEIKGAAYPVGGLDDKIFEKEYMTLTPPEKEHADLLLESIIKDVLFFTDVQSEKPKAEIAGDEVLKITARLF